MSTTAEDVSASLSEESPTLDPTDQIAELLIEDDPKTEEETGEETPAQSSNQDEEKSEEEGEANDEGEPTELEQVAEGDPTWESVLGVSEDSLSFDDAGNVVGFRTKVNGEEEIVKTSDLIAGFQNNKSFTAKSQAHAEAVKEFEVQKGQLEEVYTSKLESVDALTKHFEKQLIAEYDGIDWEKLRVEDPAEYAAARHDFSAKAGELQKVMAAIETDKNAVNKEQSEAQQKAQGEYMKTQFDAMIEKNPEWSDEGVRNEAQASFKAFVKDTYGFGDSDWNMVFDARLIELIKDAKKYHDGAKVAERKTAKPVPQFQKSRGQGGKKPVSKLAKLTAAAGKAKGAAKRDLQAGAVAELLMGGT